MKKMNALLSAFIICASLFLSSHTSKATVDLTNQNMQDSTWLGYGANTTLFYGSSANNYFRIRVNSTDLLNVSGALVGIGTTSPLSKLDINGSLAVGTYAATTAAPSNGAIISGNVGVGTSSPGSAQLAVTAPNASSTGTVINSAASPTADILEAQNNGTNVFQINTAPGASNAVSKLTLPNASSTGTIVNSAASPTADLSQWNVNGSTAARITPNGGMQLKIYGKTQIDLLTPDYAGELIQCGNCVQQYSICVASGTGVSQWSVLYSSGPWVIGRGCGSGN